MATPHRNIPSHVFVTGATGFIGKVIVEKIVREWVDTTVYVLIRPTRTSSAEKRLREDIFDSQIFARLREERAFPTHEALVAYLHTRVVAVKGDVSQPGLGLESPDLARLSATVQVAIHSAANVDFDERIDRAVASNIFGTLETLNVCRSFRAIRNVVHVSTAYVNADKKDGRILLEDIPHLAFDFDKVVADAQRFAGDEDALKTLTERVLHQTGYPNTYTLTKAISEVKISRRTGDPFKLHIVRPSIVGAAWREPVPGWVDSISAATAVFFAFSIGVITILPGNPRGVADIVPVDIVANHCLLAAIDYSADSPPVRASHCATSVENPTRWRVVQDCTHRSLTTPPMKVRAETASKLGVMTDAFTMISNPELFYMSWMARYEVPAAALKLRALITTNPEHHKTSKTFSSVNERAANIVQLFSAFTMVEYFFSAESSMRVWNETASAMLPRGKTLNVNVKEISWPQYFHLYGYGLRRYVFREDVIPITEPESSHNSLSLNTERLVHWDPDHHFISFPGLLPDITWAYTQSREPGYTHTGGLISRVLGVTGWREGLSHEAAHIPRRTKRSVPDTMNLVLTSPAVRAAMKSETKRLVDEDKQRKRPAFADGKQARMEARKRTEGIYRGVASTLVDQPPRSFAWLLRKVWRSLYDGIHVHEAGIDRIRGLLAANNNNKGSGKLTPVVLVPSHRSYVDFLVLSYVMFAYNVPVPHIAASEDFLKMGPISTVLRNSGAFFLKRDGSLSSTHPADSLYRAVFEEYMHRLLQDGQIIEFFLEGTRSRVGKSIFPKSGMLKLLQNAVKTGRVDDIHFVPVSISYERPLEVSLYAAEMLGLSKPKETIGNLFRSAQAIGKKFGCLSLQFAEPQSLNALTKEFHKQQQQQHQPPPAASPATPSNNTNNTNNESSWIALRLVGEIDFASVCYTTNLVATLLLLYRHGATFEQLLSGLAFMRTQIALRGGRVMGVEGIRPEDALTRAIDLMGGVLTKRDVPAFYQVEWSHKNWTNFVALAYYRNHISHLFSDEAVYAAAIFAHLSPSAVVSVKCSDLHADVSFLDALLRKEFVTRNHTRNTIAAMERFGVVSVSSGVVVVKDSRAFALLCSMIWPYIDGYFIAACALFALLNGNAIPEQEFRGRMLALGENLFLDSVVSHYESCSQAILDNALSLFQEWNMIKPFKVALPKPPTQPDTQYVTHVKLDPAVDSLHTLREFASKLNRLRKPGAREFSVDTAGTSFMIAQRPLMARM